MSIYTKPALNGVDFALIVYSRPDISPYPLVLIAYTKPALNAVDSALTVYTRPFFNRIDFELLPGGEAIYSDTGGAIGILVGQSIDSVEYFEVGAATEILTESDVDVVELVETGGATGILIGSGADEYSPASIIYIDAGGAVLLLVGFDSGAYIPGGEASGTFSDGSGGQSYADLFRNPPERIYVPSITELRRIKEEEEIVIL